VLVEVEEELAVGETQGGGVIAGLALENFHWKLVVVLVVWSIDRDGEKRRRGE